MLKYTSNLVVALNKYDTDTNEEINYIKEYVEARGVQFAINDSYVSGGNGAIDLANKVVDICENKCDFKLLYDINLSIVEKINKIAEEIYHANKVYYTDESLVKIKNIEKIGYGNLPICIAKTQYSISDDPSKLGYPKNYEVTVKDVNVYTGAGFVVVYLGNIMTMPGLSKHANYENIDIDDNYNIKGIF